MPLPRMRTAAGALAEIKAVDPATEITVYHIRQLIKQKRIRTLPVGCKILVDVDEVIAYMSAGVPPSSETTEVGQIRPVAL